RQAGSLSSVSTSVQSCGAREEERSRQGLALFLGALDQHFEDFPAMTRGLIISRPMSGRPPVEQMAFPLGQRHQIRLVLLGPRNEHGIRQVVAQGRPFPPSSYARVRAACLVLSQAALFDF